MKEDPRAKEAEEIEKAYINAERELARAGTLLRTTEAGKFIWANEHKRVISGLQVIVEKLRRDVPPYGRDS